MKFKAVILAGGSGERFWPLSTVKRPKQFLSVFGGESLIRQSLTRLKGLVAFEDVFVVTARDLVAQTRRELPELPRANVVGEPMRRDTGAAVALAVGLCGPDAVMGVFPADQLVAKPAAFRTAVRRAVALAKRQSSVVVLGIRPNHPATGYGYVDPATGRFVEKPDAATAVTYIRRGFLWNAGMFIARTDVFRAAFAAHAPVLAPLASGRTSRLGATYAALPKISFDYAVMEPLSKNAGTGLSVAVVPGDFGWDDVGGYGAFNRHFPSDADGNIVSGDVAACDVSGSVCIAKNGVKLALLGVKDLVVVTVGDKVLVASKDRVGELKRVVGR